MQLLQLLVAGAVRKSVLLCTIHTCPSPTHPSTYLGPNLCASSVLSIRMNFPSPGTSDSIEQQPPDVHLVQDSRLLRVVALLLVVACKEGQLSSEEASTPNDDLASTPYCESDGALTKEETTLRLQAAVAATIMAQGSSMAQHCNCCA